MRSPDIGLSFRSDIQGLRGLAVLLVITGHLFPDLLPGGFIGVDIFFVISGYVITQQIRSLWQSHSSRALAAFYARRIRRILGPALLVVVSTVITAKYLLGPIFAADAARDGLWSSLFLANLHFDNQARDYFAAGVPQSLVQHYWSLSIEEQFYLLWPLLFLIFLFRARNKMVIIAATGTLLVASLTFAMVNNYALDNLNFFNSGARAWELLAGCLLAAIQPRSRNIIVIRLFSIAALLGFSIFLEPSMFWPNAYSVLVIIAAVALCFPPSQARFRPLDNPVMEYLGDLSYLLYLWHWPILTIAKNYFVDFNYRHTLMVILLTLVTSIASHYLFEKPLRSSQLLIKRPALTITGGLTIIAISAIYLGSFL
jgi:peptidoglycan/LPS O-acetylase OafA/YrhL